MNSNEHNYKIREYYKRPRKVQMCKNATQIGRVNEP
jgi:hypothetical protein